MEVQRKKPKMVKRMGLQHNKERLRCLGLSSMGKRRLGEMEFIFTKL